MDKICFVYYSLTKHNSSKIVNEIRKNIKGDIKEITEQIDREGYHNLWTYTKEYFFNEDNSKYLNTAVFDDIAKYRTIVFIGPIWGHSLSSPMKYACEYIAPKLTPQHHVFLGLSYKSKTNSGIEKAQKCFNEIFENKVVVHANILTCQEDDFNKKLCSEQLLRFENEILQTVDLPPLKKIQGPDTIINPNETKCCN